MVVKMDWRLNEGEVLKLDCLSYVIVDDISDLSVIEGNCPRTSASMYSKSILLS